MGVISSGSELTEELVRNLIRIGSNYFQNYKGPVCPQALGKEMRNVYAGWAAAMRDDGEKPDKIRGPLSESELCTKAAEAIKQTMRLLTISNYLQGQDHSVVRAILKGEYRKYLAKEQVCDYKDVVRRLRLIPSLAQAYDSFRNSEIPRPLEARLRYIERQFGMGTTTDKILEEIGYHLPPAPTPLPERAAAISTVVFTPLTGGFYRPDPSLRRNPSRRAALQQ